MNNLLEKILEKNNSLKDITKAQNQFLETNLGRAINTGINFGLKIILPDVIEDDVIEVKDALIKGGLKEGTNMMIEKAINIGKSFEGIFTGTFETMSQVKTAVTKGGLVDSISTVLDSAIDWAKKKKYLSTSVAKMIKEGKKEVMKSVKRGIDQTLEDQVVAVEKIDKYINKWKKYYDEQDFQNMEYQYKQIGKYLEKTMPLEKVIKQAREIQLTHELIKKNGKSFQLSEEQKKLIKMFAKD